jgi:hypothetical protein
MHEIYFLSSHVRFLCAAMSRRSAAAKHLTLWCGHNGAQMQRFYYSLCFSIFTSDICAPAFNNATSSTIYGTDITVCGARKNRIISFVKENMSFISLCLTSASRGFSSWCSRSIFNLYFFTLKFLLLTARMFITQKYIALWPKAFVCSVLN